jgi:hypothetical protein
VLVQVLEVFEELDVRFEPNAHTIGRRHGTSIGGVHSAASRPRGAPMRVIDHLGRRGRDELAGGAVEDHRCTGGNAQRRVMQADNGRHLE